MHLNHQCDSKFYPFGVYVQNYQKKEEKLVEAIRVMQGGVEFYKEGMDKVSNIAVKNLFANMVYQKSLAIKELNLLINDTHLLEAHKADCIVNIRRLYTKLASKLRSNSDFTYVNQLEEVEDRVLDTLDNA